MSASGLWNEHCRHGVMEAGLTAKGSLAKAREPGCLWYRTLVQDVPAPLKHRDDGIRQILKIGVVDTSNVNTAGANQIDAVLANEFFHLIRR